MPVEETQTTMRLVRPRTAEQVLRGLRCLIGGPECPGQERAVRDAAIERQIAGFLDYTASMAMETASQVVALTEVADAPSDDAAWQRGRANSVCYWAASAGRSAMLFTPSVKEYPGTMAFSRACVLSALQDAQKAGVVLVQAMMDPMDTAGTDLFQGATLSPLATLVYMERRVPLVLPTVAWAQGITLHKYEAATHAEFAQAILGSYEKTLDCPALSGMRAIDDVMAGHKAVGGPGNFDPALWTLVKNEGRPVGCVLLARIPQRQALDLVYLGLAPAARGSGLGRTMMQHVLAEGYRQRCALISLAVDELNLPALRLYKRFGFSNVQRRLAMIKQL